MVDARATSLAPYPLSKSKIIRRVSCDLAGNHSVVTRELLNHLSFMTTHTIVDMSLFRLDAPVVGDAKGSKRTVCGPPIWDEPG